MPVARPKSPRRTEPSSARRMCGGCDGCSGCNAVAVHNPQNGAGYHGIVKSFNTGTGWGMISSPEMQSMYGKDIFFSRTAVRNGWVQEGEQVFFSIKMEAKGPAASSVQVVNRPLPPQQWGPMAGGGGWGGGYN